MSVKTFTIITIASLSFVFLSCMHVGMMGTGGGHQSGASHEMSAESVLEKEVIVGDIKATATFPPLQMDNDVVVSLRLVDVKTSQPISGAKVYFHAQYAHPLDQNEAHDHAGAKPSEGVLTDNGRQESEHDINIEQELKESREAGVYSIPYGSTQPGEHSLMFHIAAIGDRKFEPEIVIEAKRMLMQQSHEQSGGMMGMSGATPYIVVGAVVMSAFMVAMLLSRGGMF